MPLNVELPECGFHDKLSQPRKKSFVALCLFLGNPEVLKIISVSWYHFMYLRVLLLAPLPVLICFHFRRSVFQALEGTVALSSPLGSVQTRMEAPTSRAVLPVSEIPTGEIL